MRSRARDSLLIEERRCFLASGKHQSTLCREAFAKFQLPDDVIVWDVRRSDLIRPCDPVAERCVTCCGLDVVVRIERVAVPWAVRASPVLR